ncbi:Norsolorinic acid ketoreductase nor1 [Paramyrothecium foliicola]|nr:Norsolorinic acid ketoreductase nor1 [Paramyrothecium foliicola]
MTTCNILVTGANRGLGLGLVERFVALPDHTVIAAVRDPEHATSRALKNLARGSGSNLIIVRYDAGVWADASTVGSLLQRKYGIHHLDVVVANAAIATKFPLVKDVQRDDLLKHLEVNVLGVVALYQAMRHLLQKSTRGAKYVIMGTPGGSIREHPDVANGLYGASKSTINWYGVRLHREDEWLNTFLLDPGWVQTDMGNTAAQGWGVAIAPVTIEESCDGAVRVITEATKEKYGGKMVLYTGEILPW